MAITSLIIGESGTGKTSSLRNFNPNEIKLIQCFQKPLPFRNKGYDISVCTEINDLLRTLTTAKQDVIIVDDITYLMSVEFMNRLTEKSFDKFNDIANNIWRLVNTAIYTVAQNKRVYLIGHTDNSTDIVRLKTLGKLLDDKVNVEGMVTIVFRTCIRNKQYCFTTRNNGADTVKTPFDMFSEQYIENDLKAIDELIKNYYNITCDNIESEVTNVDNNNFNNNVNSQTSETVKRNVRRNPRKKANDINNLDLTKFDKMGENIPFNEL